MDQNTVDETVTAQVSAAPLLVDEGHVAPEVINTPVVDTTDNTDVPGYTDATEAEIDAEKKAEAEVAAEIAA